MGVWGGGWSVFKEGKLFFTLGHGGGKCCCLLRVFPIMLYTVLLTYLVVFRRKYAPVVAVSKLVESAEK